VMPTVTVAGPGLAFTTLTPADDERVIVLRNPVSRQVLVMIAKPAAGRYTFTSAEEIATVARGLGVAPPKVAVRVTPRRDGTATLRYRITGLAGRKLKFMERGTEGGRTIGTASGSAGRIEYRPIEGPARRRTIYAVYGRAGETVRVASYGYLGPPPARRPGRITGRLDAAGFTIRVARAKGSVLAYRMVVTIGRRTVRRTVNPRTRKMVVPLVSKGERVKVSVVALNAIRKPSAARTAV